MKKTKRKKNKHEKNVNGANVEIELIEMLCTSSESLYKEVKTYGKL